MSVLTRLSLSLAALVALVACGRSPLAPVSTQPLSPLLAEGHTSGFVHVAPGGRYLADAVGHPFFEVGHDECFGGFSQPLHTPAKLDELMGYMQTHGQNTLLLQVESDGLKDIGTDVALMDDPHPGPRISLEYPAGTYNPEVARQFDTLLDAADRHGIYVITYLWDTFNMDWHWEFSTYNVKNGGPCTYVSELLTNPKAIALEKKKFQYAIERWGNRRNLLAWDLMNEIEWAVAGPVPANKDAAGNVHGATAEQMDAWVTMMGRFVRETELKRWGRSHLRTVSTNNPHYDGAWFYRNAEVDLVTNHQYLGPATNDPGTPIEAAKAVRDGVREVLARENYTKPYMDTESGPLIWDQKTGDVKLYPHDAEVFHAMIWSNWAAGAAGAGMRWPYPYYGFAGDKNLNPMSDRMANDLAAIAKTAKLVDWGHFNPRAADKNLRVADAKLLAVATSDGHQMLGWLSADTARDPRKSWTTPIAFSGFAEGHYDLFFIDDSSGAVLRQDEVSGPSFEATTPPFAGQLAVVVRPHTPGTRNP